MLLWVDMKKKQQAPQHCTLEYIFATSTDWMPSLNNLWKCFLRNEITHWCILPLISEWVNFLRERSLSTVSNVFEKFKIAISTWFLLSFSITFYYLFVAYIYIWIIFCHVFHLTAIIYYGYQSILYLLNYAVNILLNLTYYFCFLMFHRRQCRQK